MGVFFKGEEVSLCRSASSSRELDVEPGRFDPYVETPSGALQDIAIKCGTKVLRIGGYFIFFKGVKVRC